MLEPREGGEVVDTLNFWSEDDIKRTFPILCRIAAQVFVQEATTGDMKRINSRGGIYYTPHCNRLAPETVKKMIFLCGCYVRDEGGLATRQRVPKERSSKFILHQSISCQIDRNKATEDFTEFPNDLCAWVYYSSGEKAADDDDVEDDDEISDI
jgi:hypothetical protein